MNKRIVVVTLLAMWRCAFTQVPPIECPQYFQYLRLGSKNIGKITLPNVVPGTTKVFVQFSQRENMVDPNYFGNLALFDDKQTTINKLYSGQPILYRIDFPTPNVLPKLTLITVNDAVICSDRAYPPPSFSIRLSHTLTASELGGSFLPYQTSNSPVQQQFPQRRLRPTQQQILPNRVQQQQQPATTTSQQTNAVCGIENKVISPYIVGGELLSPQQFPWLAAIFLNTGGNLKFICGGTLVSQSTVITAAHCFLSPSNSIVVHLGHYDISDYSEQFEMRSVKQVIKHPEFHSTSLPDADIAILYLSAAVSFSTSIRPACLWNEQIDINLLVGQRAIVAGWGEDERRQMQSKPKKANANIVSSVECQSALSDNLISPKARALCVRSSDNSTPCRGDSGGGLVVFYNGRWVLSGIVSGGKSNDRGCLLDYTFFCNLAQHRTWLYENII